MLSQLYIRDFAIVHKLELSFAPGLTVLTGETGAGKSILIDALALALGERAESGVIRHGCERTEISAQFDLPTQADASVWLQTHDLFAEQECILRRVIERDKPSKGFINGRPVAMQMLRELGELLVDFHGQHEHQSLLKRAAQRQALDAYAGLSADVAVLAAHCQEIHSLQSRLDALRQQTNDRAARIDLLRYQIQELQTLGLKSGEMPQLEEEHARLANGAELLQGVQTISHALYDADEGAVTQILAQTINKLENLSEYDAKLGGLTQLLSEAAIQIDEAAAQLHHYQDTVELDPQRLQWIDQRLAAVHELARKHRARPEELPGILDRLINELSDIENFDSNMDKLEKQIETMRAAYMKLAQAISQKRKQAASHLAEDVSKQMQRLGMPGGRFEASLIPLNPGEISMYGLEQTEFVVSANPGQPLKPLNKVASGGELSRISLALQVVTAGLGQIPTLIFDEVDVGIGGGVAEIVGQQLHTLSGARQVLCITHLAQVAAQGDQHLQVSKLNQSGTAVTHIRPLAKKERVMEIARMIGGIEISQQTLAHAEEMLTHVPAA
ncbi:MAG TPA: DNA repair protein RecN [Acidiferrobacterales bacterium]|nr:DNA repair protein RecN [Acidiferrobacterales bacterium]